MTKIKNEYENSNLLVCSSPDNLRPGQIGMLNCILDRLSKGQKYTAGVLPTRYGKSPVARITAIEAVHQGFVGSTLVLVPNRHLRMQMVNEADLRTTMQIGNVRTPKAPKMWQINDNATATNFFHDIATMSVATIQWANANQSTLIDWVQYVTRKTGRPPLVIIDESHMNSVDNSWGTCVQALSRAGAFVFLLTATPYRADGLAIPGFDVETLNEEEGTVEIRRETSEGMIEVTTYATLNAEVRLVPHYAYSYQAAWDEGVICKLNRVTFDPEVSLATKAGTEQKRLSNILDVATARKALTQVVRDSTTIEEGLRIFVDCLETKREQNNNLPLSGLIFCGNDRRDENDDAQHVKKVLTIARSMYPNYTVDAATSADSEDAVRKINDFRQGRIDILVVKQMASIGLDIPSLKVILDLSTTRTAASFIQRIMRCATRYENVFYGDYVAPTDMMGEALFHRFVTEEGGEVQKMTVRAEVLQVIEVEAQVTELAESVKKTVSVQAVLPGKINDTDMNSASADDFALARAAVRYKPYLSSWSIPLQIDLARGFWPDGVIPEQYGDPTQKAPVIHQIEDLSKKLARVKLTRDHLVKELASIRSLADQGKPGGQSPFGDYMKAVYTDAKRGVGLPHWFSVKKAKIHEEEWLIMWLREEIEALKAGAAMPGFG